MMNLLKLKMSVGQLVDTVVPPLATAAAIAVYLGSASEVHKWNGAGGTGSMSPLPYVMLAANAAGWLLYGLREGIVSIALSNAVGLLIAIYVLMAFGAAAPPPARLLWTRFLIVAAIYVALLALAGFVFAAPSAALGLVCSVVAVAMFASPLATLRLVLQTQSAESLPAPMILLGLCCTSLWTLYGLRVDNIFMYGPNGLALMIGVAQVVLLIQYRKSPSTSTLPI